MAGESGSQIICIGTAWVEGTAGTELQFSRRGLDISFLTNLHVILQGIDWGVRRIGSSLPAPEHAAHVYEFSAEFRRRLGELTPERVKEIGLNWYSLQGYKDVSTRPDRVEYHTEIIQNLAAMAQVAEARSTRLLLRAEYKAAFP